MSNSKSNSKVASQTRLESVSLHSIWRSNRSPQEAEPILFLSSKFGLATIKGLAEELNLSTSSVMAGDRVHPLIGNVYRCWLRWQVES